jgi:hypothetical protein
LLNGARQRVPPTAAIQSKSAPQVNPSRTMPGGQSLVVQPMYSGNMTTSVPNLDTVAQDLSQSHGYKETATFAVVNQENADFSIYGQRYYEKTYAAVPQILTTHGIGLGVDYVTPDTNEEYVHAEMLAVSEWLAGNKDKPEMIGASRVVCSYCAIVLKHLGITIFSKPSPDPTPNWANPWYLNKMQTPNVLKALIPLKYRKKGIDYD